MKDGFCKHQKPYAECGKCRATVVRAGASKDVDADWEKEEKKREHVSGALRGVTTAAEALEDAQAHLKLNLIAKIPEPIATEVGECLRKLRAIRKVLIRADASVLMDHLGESTKRALEKQGETDLAEGLGEAHET